MSANISVDELLTHSTWLCGLARALVTEEDLAEDLVQETWRFALEHPLRHRGNLRA